MPAAKTKAKNIPGVIRPDRTVVNKPSTTTTRSTAKKKKLPSLEELTLQQVEALRELKRQKDEIEAQIALIKQELLQRMSKGDTFYTEDKAFVVSLRERANWTYSQELQKDILYLEAEMKSEQQNGTATNNPTHYVDGRAVAVK